MHDVKEPITLEDLTNPDKSKWIIIKKKFSDLNLP
jgi:hypothetical protein